MGEGPPFTVPNPSTRPTLADSDRTNPFKPTRPTRPAVRRPAHVPGPCWKCRRPLLPLFFSTTSHKKDHRIRPTRPVRRLRSTRIGVTHHSLVAEIHESPRRTRGVRRGVKLSSFWFPLWANRQRLTDLDASHLCSLGKRRGLLRSGPPVRNAPKEPPLSNRRRCAAGVGRRNRTAVQPCNRRAVESRDLFERWH